MFYFYGDGVIVTQTRQLSIIVLDIILLLGNNINEIYRNLHVKFLLIDT